MPCPVFASNAQAATTLVVPSTVVLDTNCLMEAMPLLRALLAHKGYTVLLPLIGMDETLRYVILLNAISVLNELEGLSRGAAEVCVWQTNQMTLRSGLNCRTPATRVRAPRLRLRCWRKR